MAILVTYTHVYCEIIYKWTDRLEYETRLVCVELNDDKVYTAVFSSREIDSIG